MQQENFTLDSVATVEIHEQQPESRGPVLLQPEMLAWISGGVTINEDLPRGTW